MHHTHRAELLDQVVRADQAMTLQHLPAFRTMLRTSLAQTNNDADSGPRRPGHRLDWLVAALAGYRAELSDTAFDRLVTAMAVYVGIESLIVLQDVCGLDAGEAEAVKRWAVQALLDAALREAGQSPQAATAGVLRG